jgi:hypothetical protein
MVPTDRRSLLVAGGITLAAGCLSTVDDDRAADDTDSTTTDDSESDDEALPTDVVSALEPLPTAVEGTEATRVFVLSPREDGQYGTSLADQFGLDPSDVDRAAAAAYGDRSGHVLCIVGSFDASSIDSPDGTASTTIDGRFVGAQDSRDDEGWDAGLDAAEAAAADPDASVSSDESVTELLDPVVDEQYVRVFRQFSAEDRGRFSESLDADSIEASAIATTRIEERTRRITAVVLFEDESAVDADALRSMVEENWGDGVEERSVELDGRRGVARVVYERPPRPDREASPDARFRVEYDDETGDATVRHSGEEAVDAATLTVKLDGEEASAQFADEYDTVEPGDEMTLSADPFSHVRIRWDDPDDEETFDYLGDHIVHDEETFEATYDADTSQLTITYTGEQAADTDHLELQRRSRDGDTHETEETPLSEYHETLTTGDEIVVEDVSVGDWVTIMASVTDGNRGFGTSVFTFSVRPPGHLRVERENGSTYIVYHGDSRHSVLEADVEDYRVQVDGEPASTQFDDAYDELSEGDRIELDADVGSDVRVEWTGGDEAIEVLSQTVIPDLSVTIERAGEGQVEITHDGGEPVDAGRLTVAFPTLSEDDAVTWGESGSQVEEGDSITVDVPEDARYVVVRYDERPFAGRDLEELDD